MGDFWHPNLETLSSEDLRNRQLDLARVQIGRLARNSPFYRNRGLPLSVPVLDSVDHFADIVGYTYKDEVMAAQSAEPPYGGLLTVSETELLRSYVYPNGQVVAWSGRDIKRLHDMYAGGMYTAGIRKDDRVDVTFQYHWVVAGTIWDSAVQHLGAMAIPGGAGESVRHAQAAALMRTTAIIGFSTFIERIAESGQEIGLDPSELAIRKIIVVGEWHGSDAKEQLAATFGGASVREAYGTGETGLVASECEVDPNGMHVHPDVLLEVRDTTTGELVGEGGGGEVVITPLGVHAMPVVRFRTGDITESFRSSPCECGRTTPRLGRIVGRVGSMLRVKGVFLSKVLVGAIIADVLGRTVPFQVYVDRPRGQDRVTLRLGSVGPSVSEAESLTRVFRAKTSVSVRLEGLCARDFSEEDHWFVDTRTESDLPEGSAQG